jgi:hypothetical protein
VDIPASTTVNLIHELTVSGVTTSWTGDATIRGCVVIKFKDTLPGGESYSVFYANEVFTDQDSRLTCGFDNTKDQCNMGYCTF